MLDKNFDVQSIGINANYKDVFKFVSKPENLPLWTNAFAKADESTATLVTPQGQLPIGLKIITSAESGIESMFKNFRKWSNYDLFVYLIGTTCSLRTN